jgi:cupredoxin-like protein
VKRSYGALALAVLAGAALVLAAARPHRAVVASRAALTSARAERTLSLEIAGGRVAPERVEVPKGASVTVEIINRDPAARHLALLGYEGAVSPAALPPGGAATIRFDADRPGSDFAWLVDGKPAGTFAVLGSHLVEGHR